MGRSNYSDTAETSLGSVDVLDRPVESGRPIEYKLLLEYQNLKLNCPNGVYVMPETTTLWHGVIFIHRGLYKEAVFKFTLDLSKYPQKTVNFQQDICHPLIKNRQFLLEQNMTISQLLYYIKQSFQRQFLIDLQESEHLNLDAFWLFQHQRGKFNQLAKESALKSSSSAVLFTQDFIQFSPQ